jgi:hypothetical protein
MSLLQRVSFWLRRVSTGWVTLSALVIFVLFTALVLPGQSASAEKVTGDAGSPDTSFYYSAEELYQMAEAYGAEGRSAYIRARFTFDLVWPLVYSVFLVTTISWVYGRAFQPLSRWQLANLIPLVGALFDYLENVSASLVMGRYPDQLTLIATLVPIFTSLKWIFLGGSFALILAGIVIAFWRRLGRAPS